MNNTDFSDPTDNPIGQIALDNFFFILPLALEDGASVEEAVMAAFTAAIKQANDYGNAVELLKDRRMFGGGLEAGVMGGLEDRIGGTASLIYTSSSGIGTNLVRTGQMSGTDYQFNTGHGFYRPHNSNGTTTD
ncbi:MAG: hypothetical protein HS099_03480 [Ardenticatenaceae bacterium]|nr:hypothetical protein [Ardenticatenaceae bacterium]